MFKIEDQSNGAMLATYFSENAQRRWLVLLPKEAGRMQITLRFGGEYGFIAIVGDKDYRAVETNDVTPEEIALVFEDEDGTPINLFE
jgi:hypothetical protein